MAEAIVVVLEAIEIADQHAERLAAHARAFDRVREVLVERAPVEQPGQRVEARLTARMLALPAQAEALRTDVDHEEGHDQREPDPDEQLRDQLERGAAA